MKRLALAGSIVIVTFLLGIIAVAVAQRDVRNRDASPIIRPDYARQIPEPFRANLADSGEINELDNETYEPPLDVPPPLHRKAIVRANDGGRASSSDIDNQVQLASDQSSTAAPSLLSRMTPQNLPSNSAKPPATYQPALMGNFQAPPLTPVETESDPQDSQEEEAIPDTLRSPTLGRQDNLSAPPSTSMPPSGQQMPPSGQQMPAHGLQSPPSFASPLESNQRLNQSSPSISESPSPSYSAASPSVAPSFPSRPPINSGLPSNANPSMARGNFSTVSNPSSERAHDSELAMDLPGKRQLDGPQNPNMQVQKRAPEEVQVGQPATFSLIVRNVGNVTAHEVIVADRIPRGTKLARMNPPAEERAGGQLIWSLGEMAAGAEVTLAVELIPQMEGEIGSTASVSFSSQASVRTVSTLPKLEVVQDSTTEVLVGDSMTIRVQVTNSGSGVAKDVALETDVPVGLKSTQGPSLGLALGDLAPGESRTVPLDLMAVEPGNVRNLIRAVATNAAAAESSADIRIVAPELKLDIVGPKLRYLERQATYQVTLANTGTSVARNIDIIAYLPKGLQFNSAANGGEYLSAQHAVAWGLDELAAGKSATTDLIVMPVEEGDFVVRIQGQAEGVRAEPIEKQLKIQGQSELAFTIEDDNDPIETDGQTTYQVKVTNIGTRNDSNVQVAIELPPGAEVLQVAAPVAYQTNANLIVFEPMTEMRAKDQQVYRFTLRLPQVGLQVVRALVKSSQRPVAIAKEESTEVYPDR